MGLGERRRRAGSENLSHDASTIGREPGERLGNRDRLGSSRRDRLDASRHFSSPGILAVAIVLFVEALSKAQDESGPVVGGQRQSLHGDSFDGTHGHKFSSLGVGVDYSTAQRMHAAGSPLAAHRASTLEFVAGLPCACCTEGGTDDRSPASTW